MSTSMSTRNDDLRRIETEVGALIAVLFIKEVPLRTSVKREDELVAEAAQA